VNELEEKLAKSQMKTADAKKENRSLTRELEAARDEIEKLKNGRR